MMGGREITSLIPMEIKGHFNKEENNQKKDPD